MNYLSSGVYRRGVTQIINVALIYMKKVFKILLCLFCLFIILSLVFRPKVLRENHGGGGHGGGGHGVGGYGGG